MTQLHCINFCEWSSNVKKWNMSQIIINMCLVSVYYYHFNEQQTIVGKGRVKGQKIERDRKEIALNLINVNLEYVFWTNEMHPELPLLPEQSHQNARGLVNVSISLASFLFSDRIRDFSFLCHHHIWNSSPILFIYVYSFKVTHCTFSGCFGMASRHRFTLTFELHLE